MNRIFLVIIICVMLIGIEGCDNADKTVLPEISSEELNENSNQTILKDTIETLPETILEDTIEPSSETISESLPSFSEEEIEIAKQVVDEYYASTSFQIETIKYDLTNILYEQYITEYEVGNIITFTVKIIDSENPPRGIALGRKDTDSKWKIIGEGY